MFSRDSVVVFNEVHYQPAGDDPTLEYVELYNQLAADVDLSNWRLEGDVSYDFPEGTVLGGGAYLVIAGNPAALAAATGSGGALGPYTGLLSNSGNGVVLYNNNRSFRTSSQGSAGVVADKLWSVDLQGDGNGGAYGQRTPPLAMSGVETNSGLGKVWNLFTIAGHNATTTNPSMALADSTGAATGVTFSVTGTVTGWSANGNALTSDYLFVNAGNSDPDIDWQLSGLTPGETYGLHAYGGVNRDVRLTIDRNGDGSLADETAIHVAGGGFLIGNITASPAGVIIGHAGPGSVTEGNWGGFHVFEQQATVALPVGTATDSLEGRRIMDEINYSDRHPWPVGPDGSGFTLAKRDPASGTAQPENWSAGGQTNGTPGSANTFPAAPAIGFNEIAAAIDPGFQIELINFGTTSIALGGMVIGSSDPLHADYVLPAQTLLAGEFATLDAATLGFTPDDNNRLFLFSAGKTQLIDAVRADDRALARRPDGTGRWLRPDVPTFGSANSFDLEDAIVINEIFYHADGDGDEEWLELHNRSGGPVDLTGWTLDGGIGFAFPDATSIPSGGYLVVAEDSIALAAKHPGATIIGNYSNRLGNGGDFVALEDAVGNPVDEVRYYDSGKWHKAADAGGSSLELRDPDADNGCASAWAASDESSRSAWQTYSYEGVAVDDGIGNNVYHEFLLGLLDAGELLLDDVSVVENNSIEFIQNGDFEGDAPGAAASKWRAIGTHGSHGRTVVVTDPDDPGNRCLHVVATGPTEDKHNKLETTFAGSRTVVPGNTYRISFRAKWLSGLNLVNTRLYFNYLQRTTAIEVPGIWGTPGLPNTAAVANAGPTYSGLSHSPVVPNAGQPVTVSIDATDPDGISDLTLHYSVNGGSLQNTTMSAAGDTFTGTIPGQAGGAIVRLHVGGRDSSNATSFHPAAGPDGGAFYQVQDGYADGSGLRHNFRIIMAADDRSFLFLNTNRMSNDRFPVTVIEDEQTVHYDVGLRLKASAYGRYWPAHYGFNIRFQPDRLFRGVHETISIERSPDLKEVFAKHLMNRAGGGSWSFYDDVAHIITPISGDRGLGLLSMARHTDTFFDGLYPNADRSGTLFNQELLYNPNGTTGGAEALKLNNPYNHTNGLYDLEDRGPDKEPYRWGFQIRSTRSRDDYSQLVALNQAMDLSGTALRDALDPLIDADQWMRTFAMASLNGTDDIYGRTWEHNFRYYVRPTDNRIIIFQWDLDRSFQLAAGASVPPNSGSVAKLFSIPQYRRLFDGHLDDLIHSTFNSNYATPWAAHFTTLTGDNLNGLPGYISGRAGTASASLPTAVAFQITTNGGNDFSRADSVVTLTGDGWIDVFSIAVNGIAAPVTWTDADTWQVTVPIAIGPNPIGLTAFNNRGTVVGSDSITVTNTSTVDLAGPGNIVISEFHYHPATPGPDEVSNGFTDQDWFEFIELTNIGAIHVDLTGCRFTDGIAFDFPLGTILAPGERLVIVSQPAAFEYRYGPGAATIAGQYVGNLRNRGEHVRLEAADTSPIADFSYGDALPWPDGADGDGYSLVLAGPDPANPLDWRMSTMIDGNPGTSDTVPFNGTYEDLIPYALAAGLNSEIVGDAGIVSFDRNLAADDVVVTMQFSSDLVSWAPATADQLLLLTNNGDGTVTQVWQCAESVSASQTRFARVMVEVR